MTTPDFLPEWKSVPTQHGYRPSFRLFEGQKEQFVPYRSGPRYFATSAEALREAKAYVKSVLNQSIVGETVDHQAELSELEAWRAKKERDAAAERAKVFGADDRPASVRNKSGRMAEVVYAR